MTEEPVITEKQKRLLRAIAQWRDGLVTLSGLARELGLAGESSVRVWLAPLEKAGLIERLSMGPGLPRVPRLTRDGRAFLKLCPASPTDEEPEVVGLLGPSKPMPVYPIHCGPLDDNQEEPEILNSPFDDDRSGDYLLRAVGDSMVDPHTGKGIRPGTLLHMRPDIAPRNGQTVHAEIELPDGTRQCTLKNYHADEFGSETLWAINPAYDDITGKVMIRGVALDEVRSLELWTRK